MAPNNETTTALNQNLNDQVLFILPATNPNQPCHSLNHPKEEETDDTYITHMKH